MKNYIPDGYTEPGYIADRRGIHESCRFKYRRMLHGQRVTLANSAANPQAFVKAMYVALEKHLAEWDVVKWNPNDATKLETLPINALNIASLAPQLIERLYNIVAGYDLSDDDPKVGPTIQPDELDALISGENAGDAAAAADQKN